jgi:nucleoside-diphosphate-sugar epimerase
MGTLHLLELCRHAGVEKFILASSSSLYGNGTAPPFVETANTDQVLSPYAASKKAAETLCYTYHFLYGLDVTVFRYFTVYGPAGRPDMLPFRLVQWISEGQPVVVYGDGSQTRDFTYVADIARGTCLGLQRLGFEIINLGSDQPVALLEAVELIAKLTGRAARLEHRPPHPADVLATRANTDKAERLLGWQCRTAFPDGMAELVAWYRQERVWASQVDTGVAAERAPTSVEALPIP